MKRIRWALTTGTLDVAIDDEATTIESVGLEALPAVAEGEVAVLILDWTAGPDAECVYVVDHEAESNVATVLRGQEQAVGHGPAKSHGTGTAWHLAPTPLDFGPFPLRSIEVPNETLVEISAGPDGRLEVNSVVFTGSGAAGFVTIPPARDHEGELFVTSSAPGASPGGVVEKDPTPLPATASTAGIYFALLTAIGEGNSVDLTTGTLGHAFVSRAMVNGTEFTSGALDDVYGPMISGDGYAELARLLGDLLAPFLANGVSVDMGTGTMTTDDVGIGTSIAFHPAQEAISGVDLVAALADGNEMAGAPPARPGKVGRLTALGDGTDGGLGVLDWFDPEEWEIGPAGTHTHGNFASTTQRGTISYAQPGFDRWTSLSWPVRPNMIDTSFAYGVLPFSGPLSELLIGADNAIGLDRTVTDGVVAGYSVTSATANFTADDVGSRVIGVDENGRPNETHLRAGSTILSVDSSTEVTLDREAFSSGDPVRLKIVRPLKDVVSDLVARVTALEEAP